MDKRALYIIGSKCAAISVNRLSALVHNDIEGLGFLIPSVEDKIQGKTILR